MQSRTGCDGVMIGRAAMANPWIFDARDGASLPERIDLAVELLNLMARHKGEKVGVLESRKHLALYFKGLGRDSEMRRLILTTRSLGELVDILREWRDDLEDDLPEADLTLSREEAGGLAWGGTG